MTIRATSLEAYTALEYKLAPLQQKIYEIIQKHPNVSDNDIERISGIRINNVTGRRNELFNMGLIEYNGEKTDRLTGHKVMKWVTKEDINNV
jgi:Mn-dependent DtxR family transcriptional regulator